MERLFTLLLLLTCLSSCSQTILENSGDTGLNNYEQFETKAGNSGDRYIVTNQDVESYLAFKRLESKNPEFKVKSVTPYPNDENTGVYVINYYGYWELLSSDKRTPAVIATASGEFDTNMENENFMAWINSISEEIKSLRLTDKTSQDAEKYVDFWKYITCDKEFLNSKFVRTKAAFDTTYHPWPGHYELERIDHEVVADSIDHLVQTKWGQYSPYNQFCPRVSTSDTSHCVAGCIPIAGAQMVVYYHYHGGHAFNLYEQANCNTYGFPNTDWTQMNQWDMTDYAWERMQTADSSRIAAILVANLGKSILVEYGKYNTVGRTADLVQPLSDDYYLPLTADDYDSSVILNLLEDQCPSIARSDIDVDGSGHAFIIDRYKKIDDKYTYVYVFIPDDDANGSDYTYEYCYYSPQIVHFGMNWGWYGLSDDAWFVCDTAWHLISPQIGFLPNGRKMLIYNPET